jgi:hypothetical protein
MSNILDICVRRLRWTVNKSVVPRFALHSGHSAERCGQSGCVLRTRLLVPGLKPRPIRLRGGDCGTRERVAFRVFGLGGVSTGRLTSRKRDVGHPAAESIDWVLRDVLPNTVEGRSLETEHPKWSGGRYLPGRRAS